MFVLASRGAARLHAVRTINGVAVLLIYLLCVLWSGDFLFFFSSRRRHTRCLSDWSSDVCSSDLFGLAFAALVVANITVGLCLFTVVSFLDILSNIGGSVGITKLIGLLLVLSWFATISTRGESGRDRSEERRVGKGGRCKRAR